MQSACHQEVVGVFFNFCWVLGYSRIEMAGQFGDLGGNNCKLQGMELYAVYTSAPEESQEVVEKLSYYTREFCQQQKISYTINTIFLDEVTFGMLEDNANNHPQDYRAQKAERWVPVCLVRSI